MIISLSCTVVDVGSTYSHTVSPIQVFFPVYSERGNRVVT